MSNFNDVTGDTLITKVPTKEYKKNHSIVFEDKVMVDPPSGWMYGFPALWDKKQHSTLAEFLRTKDYPEKDIEFACSYCRMWVPQDASNDDA